MSTVLSCKNGLRLGGNYIGRLQYSLCSAYSHRRWMNEKKKKKKMRLVL